MDGLFNIWGFGMQRPEDREKRGFFWANPDKKKRQDTSISQLDSGPLGSMVGTDQGKGASILPSDTRYPGSNQLQKKALPFHPNQGGDTRTNVQQDPNWWNKLANMAGVDMTKAAAQWKDKGGFEGLMANPAFTMGLAFMQAGAEGKTLGQGALNNVMKAAGVSSHYKRLMEAKAGGVIEASEGQMNQIKSVLATKGIDKPGWWRKMFPGNQSEAYEQAVEDVTVAVQKKVNKMKADAKASGKDIVVGNRLYKKIIDDMIASGEIKRVGGVKLGGYQIVDASLEDKSFKAQGGPVTKGQPYVVGEGGPEYFLPKESGKILSNDDSRIFSMLLAANPQLQNVSRTRSEKILRNRFPEYFE